MSALPIHRGSPPPPQIPSSSLKRDCTEAFFKDPVNVETKRRRLLSGRVQATLLNDTSVEATTRVKKARLDNPEPPTLKNQPLLLKRWANEITQDLKTLAQSHNLGETNSFTSGRTFYLLRRFCGLIVDPKTNTFNPKGAAAAIELLLNPIYNISHHLPSEHRKQVIRVIQCCLKSKEIQKLLVHPYTPHPEMQELIALNLQTSIKEIEENPVHLSHTLLLTLLSYLKQRLIGNCYAIAPLILEIHANPYGLLKELVSLLQSGHFVLKKYSEIDITVPILPIVRNRFNDEKPLEAEELSDQIALHPAIIKSTSLLDMDVSQLTPHKKRSISRSLRSIANKSEAGESYPKLVRHLAAFDNCPLQHLLLLNRELRNVNSQHQKIAFFNHITSLFSLACYANVMPHEKSDPFTHLRLAFSKMLNRVFWLEDIPISTVGQNSFGPSFDRRMIPEEASENPTLRELIKRGRFLFMITNGTYTRIDTITQFQHHLASKCAQLPVSQKIKASIAAYLESKQVYSMIAMHLQVSARYKNFEIPIETIEAANLMIFPQSGGIPVSPINNRTLRLSPSSPKNCLVQLHELFSSMPTNWHLPLLTACKSHGFNLTPDHFSHLLNQTCTERIINQEVEKRFDELLDKPVLAVAQDLLTREIPTLTITKEEASTLTHGTLLEKLKEIAPPTLSPFHAVTIHAFSLIECSPILIHTLLSNFSLDPAQIDKIYEGLSNIYLTTQHFAEEFSQQLQQREMATIDPIKLERIICKLTNRPISFTLGSLNWSAEGPDSNSVALEIAFEPVTQEFVYFAREEGRAKRPIDPQEFTKFDIHLPNPDLVI